MSYRFDACQIVGHLIVEPLYVPHVGGELSDIIQVSELSWRALVGVFVERICKRVMICKDGEISPLYGVSKSFERGGYSE